MSAPGPDIKRGRLSADEEKAIEALAGRKLKAGQIATRLNRHPATVNFAMHRMGLKEPATRQCAPYTRKNGSRVCLFDDAEDAMIEAMRAEGNTCSRIAAACFVWFGRKRSAATVGVRLRMLANRKEAAE